MKRIADKLLKFKSPVLIGLANCIGALCFAILLVALYSLYQHFQATQHFLVTQNEVLLKFDKDQERIFERVYGVLHLSAERIATLPSENPEKISHTLTSSQRLALRYSPFSFEKLFYISANLEKRMFSRFGVLPDRFEGDLHSVVSSQDGLNITQLQNTIILQKAVIAPNETLMGVVQLTLSLPKLIQALSVSPSHFQITGVNLNKDDVQQGTTRNDLDEGQQPSLNPREALLFQKQNINPLSSQIKILVTKHRPQTYVEFLLYHQEWYRSLALIGFLLALSAFVIWRLFLSREVKTLRQKNEIFAEQTQQLYCKLTEVNRSLKKSHDWVECWKTTLNARQEYLTSLQAHDKKRATLIQKSLL